MSNASSPDNFSRCHPEHHPSGLQRIPCARRERTRLSQVRRTDPPFRTNPALWGHFSFLQPPPFPHAHPLPHRRGPSPEPSKLETVRDQDSQTMGSLSRGSTQLLLTGLAPSQRHRHCLVSLFTVGDGQAAQATQDHWEQPGSGKTRRTKNG